MNHMKDNWALITGASSGIGRELAKIHAIKGGHSVLIARNNVALQTLAFEIENKYGVKAEILALDLTAKDSIKNVTKFLQEKNIELSCLINNAGFGGYGRFDDRPIEVDCNMIDLNVKALVHLTHACIPLMKKSKQRYILNVASIAAFFPGPFQATYFATKAFVISFSHALSTELKKSNISVTAACPGPVHTNFEKTAQMESLGFFKNALSAQKTALRAYKAMLSKRKELITDYSMALPLRLLMPIFPRRWRSYIIYRVQKPK